MPLSLIAPAFRFEEAFVLASKLHDVAAVRVDDKGIRTALSDHASVMLISVEMARGAFKEFEWIGPPEGTDFYVPLSHAATFLESVRKLGIEDDVSVFMDHGKKMVMRCGRVRVERPLDAYGPNIKNIPPIEKLDLRAMTRLDAKQIKLLATTAEKLGTESRDRASLIIFTVKDGKLVIESKDDSLGTGATIDMDDVVPLPGADGVPKEIEGIRTCLGIDVLNQMVACFPQRQIEILFGNDVPIAFRYADEHLRFLGLIAPRVEEA
jgi:hypothetical protein